MKVLFTILMLCLGGQYTYGQNYYAAIEMPEMNIMYRGYSNKFEVAVTNVKSSNIILECSNCKIEKSEHHPLGYFITPLGKERTLYLSVLVRNNGDLIVVKRIQYRVQNLPTPQLYWGGAKEGTKAHIRSTKLFAKYPPEIPLNATFKVLGWELQTENDTINGSGSNLSSAEKILKKIKKSTAIKFIATIVGPDGIRRKITEKFKVDTWAKSKPYKIEPCGG